ncbi:unnamed protein product, partial [marine sediment metagenome]
QEFQQLDNEAKQRYIEHVKPEMEQVQQLRQSGIETAPGQAQAGGGGAPTPQAQPTPTAPPGV